MTVFAESPICFCRDEEAKKKNRDYEVLNHPTPIVIHLAIEINL